jgi:hypothetical protein
MRPRSDAAKQAPTEDEGLAELDRLGISYSKLRNKPDSAWWKPMTETHPVADRIANTAPIRPGS